jgi:hypothetical protein
VGGGVGDERSEGDPEMDVKSESVSQAEAVFCIAIVGPGIN